MEGTSLSGPKKKPSARCADDGPGDPPDVEGNLMGFMAHFWEVDDFKAAAQSEHEETFNFISTSRLWAFYSCSKQREIKTAEPGFLFFLC